MNFYDIKVITSQGEPLSLSEFKGKVLLVVNTATGCGFTPQYKGLQTLYEKYQNQGFEILDFPTNQFAQAPESIEEINQFCSLNYGTTFPRFAKVEVNGDKEAEIFTYLKKERSGLLGSNIKWNFTKFLVDRQGNVVKRFAPTDTPASIDQYIQELL